MVVESKEMVVESKEMVFETEEMHVEIELPRTKPRKEKRDRASSRREPKEKKSKKAKRASRKESTILIDDAMMIGDEDMGLGSVMMMDTEMKFEIKESR